MPRLQALQSPAKDMAATTAPAGAMNLRTGSPPCEFFYICRFKHCSGLWQRRSCRAGRTPQPGTVQALRTEAAAAAAAMQSRRARDYRGVRWSASAHPRLAAGFTHGGRLAACACTALSGAPVTARRHHRYATVRLFLAARLCCG